MTLDWLDVADWGGSIAAAVSIVFLFRKSIGYWYASIVATVLWFLLFLATDSAMVAGLQLSYTLFAAYGIARWRLERTGRPVPSWLDASGTGIALAIFAVTIAATAFDAWQSYVELAAVALSLLANWLTARKVIWCWPVWMSTNVLFAALFLDLELWGLFVMQFVYFALSVVGLRAWLRAGRNARREPEPVIA